MISFLRGEVIEKNFGSIIIDVNGTGYRVNITLDCYVNIAEGKEALIYVFHHIWQDGQELYGFLNKIEREVFRVITSVSGVGPKLCSKILQNVEYKAFVTLISEGNISGLIKINGLGKKTAEKLIFELKEKFIKLFSPIISPALTETDSTLNIAVNALVSLGFKEKESINVITDIYNKNKEISVENLIKEGLSLIYKN
jgi:Holliday junction DNA helicase RuvA